jgi:hypothetical protein
MSIFLDSKKLLLKRFGIKEFNPQTAYNYWNYNIGLNAKGKSQFMGPLSGGAFDTRAGATRPIIWKITWYGTGSIANFAIGLHSEPIDRMHLLNQ